ncbi:hypothetical protein [Streptomyces sp. D54]|uniref:hypothetical protein n=1 Tax=Streptomyces sp. D54 TaxID=1290289 RepID=UPI003CF79149
MQWATCKGNLAVDDMVAEIVRMPAAASIELCMCGPMRAVALLMPVLDAEVHPRTGRLFLRRTPLRRLASLIGQRLLGHCGRPFRSKS